MCRLRLTALPVVLVSQALFAQDALDEITVVASTPLGTSTLEDSAGNVQAIDGDELRRQRVLSIAEMMNNQLGSIFVNEAQNNPLQPDVQFRGFVGSPLLGLPQGLAVYQDGVRINEPFGDTVNWALIPDVAIESLQLVPGSNPMFGLNALGGAIAIRTRNGSSSPGTSASLAAGSYGRTTAKIRSGGSVGDSFSYFAAASWINEDGWRDFSGTEAAQVFASLRWETPRSMLETKLTAVDTTLTGNGAAPLQLLQEDREAVFTHPDDTENRYALVSVTGSHTVSDEWSLVGNAYVRLSDTDTLNGDDSDYEACDFDPAVLCLDDELVEGVGGQPIQAIEALEGATINRTATDQDGMGFSLQAESEQHFGRFHHELVAGVAHDRAEIDFSSNTELGALDDSRRAIPGGAFPAAALTRLEVDTRNSSLYLADTIRLTDGLRLNIGGRYNQTTVELRDQLGTALDGDHQFNRFNASASLNYSWSDTTAYLRYSESSRTPSPVELTCADEDDPCRLPNAFLSDPPLEMVVARTWEAGVRSHSDSLHWHAGVFHTISDDDIIFISAGSLTNEGFFDNVGQVRRYGLELNLVADISDKLQYFTNYTFLDATYRDRLCRVQSEQSRCHRRRSRSWARRPPAVAATAHAEGRA